jgi:phospholipase C
LARTARNAQALNSKTANKTLSKTAGKMEGQTAPKPAGRRPRQGGKPVPAGAGNGGKSGGA